jgi:outer membrane lipopolysaccharide assembly protein LptE/RlpB
MRPALLAAALTAALMSSGCGFRIVRNADVSAKRFAQDSASIATLERQLTTLSLQCRSDSTRLEKDLATARAAAAVQLAPPPSDSALKARTAEVAALKEQLTKVTAELDRIKRRLANPRG